MQIDQLPPIPGATVPRFTSKDQELVETRDYQIVIALVRELWSGGIIPRGSGYCLSMSDMIQTLLKQQGIDSHLEECKLTILGIDPPNFKIIGQTGLYKPDRRPEDVDTHVVCVTDTKIPMIIDLSVYSFREEVPYVVERLNGRPGFLAELDFTQSRWVYQLKDRQRLVDQHQTSILNRIQTDQRVRRQITWLQWAVIAVMIIAGLNALRGAYDFYTTYIDEDNYWGPAHIRQLIEKVDRLEELVKLPQDQRGQ